MDFVKSQNTCHLNDPLDNLIATDSFPWKITAEMNSLLANTMLGKSIALVHSFGQHCSVRTKIDSFRTITGLFVFYYEH